MSHATVTLRPAGPRTGIRARRTAGRAIEVTLLTALALLVVSPIYWTLVTSLRTPAQSFSNPPAWIPAHPLWSN